MILNFDIMTNYFAISSTFTFNELCFTFHNFSFTRCFNHQGKGVINTQRPSVRASRKHINTLESLSLSYWFQLLEHIVIQLKYVTPMAPYLPFLMSRASAILTAVRRLRISNQTLQVVGPTCPLRQFYNKITTFTTVLYVFSPHS